MNFKKLSLSGLLLSFSILFSISSRVVANNQAQIIVSSKCLISSQVTVVLALIIGLIGIAVSKIITGIPTDPELPPEERKKPVF